MMLKRLPKLIQTECTEYVTTAMPHQLDGAGDVMDSLWPAIIFSHGISHLPMHADLEVRSNVKKLQSMATLYSN